MNEVVENCNNRKGVTTSRDLFDITSARSQRRAEESRRIPTSRVSAIKRRACRCARVLARAIIWLNYAVHPPKRWETFILFLSQRNCRFVPLMFTDCVWKGRQSFKAMQNYRLKCFDADSDGAFRRRRWGTVLLLSNGCVCENLMTSSRLLFVVTLMKVSFGLMARSHDFRSQRRLLMIFLSRLPHDTTLLCSKDEWIVRFCRSDGVRGREAHFPRHFYEEQEAARLTSVIDYSAEAPWWIIVRPNFSNFSSSGPRSHVNQPTAQSNLPWSMTRLIRLHLMPGRYRVCIDYPPDPTIHLFHFSRNAVCSTSFSFAVSPFSPSPKRISPKRFPKTRARNEKRGGEKRRPTLKLSFVGIPSVSLRQHHRM